MYSKVCSKYIHLNQSTIIRFSLHLIEISENDFWGVFLEDGGVDTTVIESRQHKMGQMADFPPLLAFQFLAHKT